MKRVRYVGIVFANGSLERPSFRLVWNLANRYASMARTITACTIVVIKNAQVQVVFGLYIFLLRGTAPATGGVRPSRE